MNIETNAVVLITGATSGIGLATATYLAGRGYKVYGTCRHSSDTVELDQVIQKSRGLLEKVFMDVADEKSVQEAIKQILLHKKIDVVINNAGYALLGTVESCTLKQQKKLFDTNFFGAVNVIQAVLPHFREQGKGQIINIGSVVGITPFPVLEIYSASKFALAGLTESMAVTLAPFNIKVSIVEPGSVQTLAASHHTPIGDKDLGLENPYIKFHEIGEQMCINNLASGRDPFELAQFIHAILQEEKPKLRYPFGDFAVSQVATRLKDPSGSINVDKQIQIFTESGLLPEISAKIQNF
ncbi:MAG: SDR family oxidoreductase [Parachlamydiaceae bacterium]|nr:SDR family oxidoreductase [Parachlamydiaceae bacterium]